MEFISERVSVNTSRDAITVIISPDIEGKKQMLLLVWIMLWTAGGLIVISQVFGSYSREEKMFFAVWICFWFYFEYMVIYAWLWKKQGFEKLVIKEDIIQYRKGLKGKGKLSVFHKNLIRNLRFTDADKSIINSLNNSYWVVGGEKIAFDYQTRTVKLGMKLDKKEALEIIKIIQRSI